MADNNNRGVTGLNYAFYLYFPYNPTFIVRVYFAHIHSRAMIVLLNTERTRKVKYNLYFMLVTFSLLFPVTFEVKLRPF